MLRITPERLGHVEDAFDVDPKDTLQVHELGLQDRPDVDHARIVDEDVGRESGVARCGETLADARGIGDVHAHGKRGIGAGQRRRLLPGARDVDVGKHHAGALAREGLRDRESDSSGSARDERRLALHAHGVASSRQGSATGLSTCRRR